MSEDPNDVAVVDPIAPLRERLLAAVVPAIETLARAGRGEGVFETVEQMRSCFVLARLAPLLLGARPTKTQDDELAKYIEMTPEQEAALIELEKPSYGPPYPGWAFLDDPNKEQKFFSWEDSCRRAGLDTHEVFEATQLAARG